MKIGVMSDSHGDLAAIRQGVNQIPDADMWLHAGDCSQDAEYLRSLVTVPVLAAKGNCDGHTAAKIDEFLEVEERKIWLTHGHRYGVKQGTQDLVEWGKDYEIDIIIYGHTHKADNRWCEGILLFNPGSSYGGQPSWGVLEIYNGQISARIIDSVM